MQDDGWNWKRNGGEDGFCRFLMAAAVGRRKIQKRRYGKSLRSLDAGGVADCKTYFSSEAVETGPADFWNSNGAKVMRL
jgi:hypothetical protein